MRIALDERGFPRWPGDDVEFVCQKIAAMKTAPNIAELVKFLGFEDRNGQQQVTPEYNRIRAALHAAHKANRLRRLGRRWGLMPKAPPKTMPTRAGQAVLAAVAAEQRGRR